MIWKKVFICQYCGKEFVDYARNNRKYCSKKCGALAHSYNSEGRRAEFMQIPASVEIRETALRLYNEGKTAYAISKLLGCSNGRVESWLKRERKRAANPEQCREWPEPYFRYVYANNAEVWLEVLRDEMRRSGFNPEGSILTPVCLISGTMHIHKSADSLATIVTEKLKLDIFNDKSYAFCGNDRNKLRILRWDGGGYQMISRRRERGSYVWPPARFGMTVTVTAEEFEFILLGSQHNAK
jgi:transposase-like protein